MRCGFLYNYEYIVGVNKADSFPRVGVNHIRTEKDVNAF